MFETVKITFVISWRCCDTFVRILQTKSNDTYVRLIHNCYHFSKFFYDSHFGYFVKYCFFGLSFNRVVCTLPTIEFQKTKLSNRNLYWGSANIAKRSYLRASIKKLQISQKYTKRRIFFPIWNLHFSLTTHELDKKEKGGKWLDIIM